jgi:phosphatidylglycerol:prolipoprotein diacylglycerol transferase
MPPMINWPTLAFVMPAIDPVIVQLGPLAIRWYALAYVAGLLLGWLAVRVLVQADRLWVPGQRRPSALELDDLLVYAAIGVVVGGRVGHVLFYGLPYYTENPGEILQVWHGGMAFHGGFIGVILAVILFAHQKKISALTLFDLMAIVAPIGLFFGRLANFVNQELWGRVTDVPWGVVFITGGPFPRHPSQLYEATLEGLLPFILLSLLVRRLGFRRPGLYAGLFGILYALARSFCELYREQDASERLAHGFTMGMALSLPMLLAGVGLVVAALRRRPVAAVEQAA